MIADWLMTNPVLGLLAAGAAGFIDGLNPCAFATLLLFLAALAVAVDRAGTAPDLGAGRLRVWQVSGAYIAGMFGLYWLLGLGLINVAWLEGAGAGHWFSRLAALAAVGLGLLMMRGYFYPDSALQLGIPSRLHSLVRRWTQETTVGGALVAGVVVGLCTIPCGGAMYLAVAAAIAAVGSRGLGLGLLTSYNLGFILPLVLLVALVSSRPVFRRLARWQVRQRGKAKLAMGLVVVVLGLLVLATT